jgi:hypothetical protein
MEPYCQWKMDKVELTLPPARTILSAHDARRTALAAGCITYVKAAVERALAPCHPRRQGKRIALRREAAAFPTPSRS